jgi:hypothetical protein
MEPNSEREISATPNAENIGEILENLPLNLLVDEILSRGPSAVANVAKQAAEANNLHNTTREGRRLSRLLTGFVDPEERLDSTQQLATMDSFYSLLGINLPKLDLDNQEALKRSATTHPELRIVPVPESKPSFAKANLMIERSHFFERVLKAFPGCFAPESTKPLWQPDPAATYAHLLAKPEEAMVDTRDPAVTYVLRYKTQTGELKSNRERKLQALASGQAVEDEKFIWTYTMADVKVHSERAEKKVGDLYKEVDPSLVPMAVLVINGLHLAVGYPNQDWGFDLSNEAIYKLRGNSEPNEESLYRVHGTRWDRTHSYVHSGGCDVDERSGRFGVRKATNALPPRS